MKTRRMGSRVAGVVLASVVLAGVVNVAAATPAQAADRWTYQYNGAISAASHLQEAKNWAGLAVRVGAGCAASTFVNSTIRSLSGTFGVGWTIGTKLVGWLSGGDSACQAAYKMSVAAYHLYFNGYKRNATQTYRVWVKRQDIFLGIDRCQYYIWVAGAWRVGGSGIPPLTTGRPPSGCFGE